MRKSRFTDEQVVTIGARGGSRTDRLVAKRHGISEQTIYTWRKDFGTFQADDVRRLKQLEAENARLKKLVAERRPRDRGDGGHCKKMVSVPARRAGVAYATGKGLSQRRACTLLGVGRSALHYCSTKLAKDAPVLARMAELAAQYPRYGYRRIAIFLGRDGHVMSFGRVHRLWRQARLQVPRKRPRKRIATGRPRPNAPTGANQVWSYDFVFDWCANGQQLQVPDRHRRMDKRGSCDRGGWPHPFRPRDRSVVAAGVRARCATVFALGQRAGVCLPRLAKVDRRPRHRHRIDRSG